MYAILPYFSVSDSQPFESDQQQKLTYQAQRNPNQLSGGRYKTSMRNNGPNIKESNGLRDSGYLFDIIIFPVFSKFNIVLFKSYNEHCPLRDFFFWGVLNMGATWYVGSWFFSRFRRYWLSISFAFAESVQLLHPRAFIYIG